MFRRCGGDRRSCGSGRRADRLPSTVTSSSTFSRPPAALTRGQAYGYNQGYAQDPVSQIINSLLGNRYNVTDRQAVSQCASAAMTQAQAQYGNGYNQGYGNNGYNRGYQQRDAGDSITDVQRRNNGLRVSGLMSSGYAGQYGKSRISEPRLCPRVRGRRRQLPL